MNKTTRGVNMTIYFTIDFNEDDIAPDYEADSWEDLQNQLSQYGFCTIDELKKSYKTGKPIDITDENGTITVTIDDIS